MELVTQAVDDAKENAKINGITNSDFFAGKAEEILSSICYRAKSDDVIGIIDPPRAGLRKYDLFVFSCVCQRALFQLHII